MTTPHAPVRRPRRSPVPRRAVGAAALTASAALLVAARPVPPRPAPATPTAQGVTFVWQVTSSSTDKNRKKALDQKTRVQVAGGKVRMDWLEGTAAGFGKDGYVVIDGDAGTFHYVNPKDKQVMVMDAATFGTGMGAMLNNPMMKMTVSDVSFDYQDLGAGEAILGYPTRKVRVHSGSTVEVKILGMTQRTTTRDTIEQWIGQVKGIDQASLGAWGRSFGAGVKGANAELGKLMEPYMKEYGAAGIALKSVSRTTIIDKNNKSEQDVVTMQVTELTPGDIAASVFEIPANYEVVNLGEAMKAATAQMDSANKANGKEPAKKPSAADAVKSGLGGLFKKKPPV